MDYALQLHLYRNVPVYLWPWVWWQLFQIERWIKETGRMVLGGVARDGKVYVLHVADDPNAPNSWSPKDLRPLKGRHQDWIASISKLSPRVPLHDDQSCPHGERSRTIGRDASMVRLRSPCGTYNPTRYGDQLMLAMRLLEWPLMLALVGCNEPLRIAPTPLAQPPPILKTSQYPTFPGLTRDLPTLVRTCRTRSRVKPGTIGHLNHPPTEPHPRARPHVLPMAAAQTPCARSPAPALHDAQNQPAKAAYRADR